MVAPAKIKTNRGNITTVRGRIVEAQFHNGTPKVYRLLKSGAIEIIVVRNLESGRVRGISLTPAEPAQPGAEIEETNRIAEIPLQSLF